MTVSSRMPENGNLTERDKEAAPTNKGEEVIVEIWKMPGWLPPHMKTPSAYQFDIAVEFEMNSRCDRTFLVPKTVYKMCIAKQRLCC